MKHVVYCPQRPQVARIHKATCEHYKSSNPDNFVCFATKEEAVAYADSLKPDRDVRWAQCCG